MEGKNRRVTVRRKAYSYRRGGTTIHVPATIYTIKDVGAKGRGPRKIPVRKRAISEEWL